MSGEEEVGSDLEPIRAVVRVGVGNGEKIGWTEGVAEEGSEWGRFGLEVGTGSSCLRLPLEDVVASARDKGEDDDDTGITKRLRCRMGNPQPQFPHLVPMCCSQISRHKRLSSARAFQ